MKRKIDKLGRLVIPKEIRKELNIREEDDIDIQFADNKIILTKPNDIDYKAIINNAIREINNINSDDNIYDKLYKVRYILETGNEDNNSYK